MKHPADSTRFLFRSPVAARWPRVAIPALAAVLLASCVDVDRSVAWRPTEQWKPPAEATPRPDGARPGTMANPRTASALVGMGALDLPLLVDIALENNPQTRVSWFAAKSVAAQYGQSLSSYYPQVSLGYELSRNKLKNEIFRDTTYYQTAYGPTLDINWLLFNFGQREATADAAREALYAANFTYNQTYQDVVLDVITAYFQMHAAQATVEATKALLANTEATYDAASKKLQSGLGNKQDTLRALASVKSAEAQLQQNIADVERARANLAQVLGIQVGAYLEIVPPLEPPSFQEMDADVSRLLALALEQRPSLLSAYANVREADANLQAAQADLWPELTAGVSGTYQQTDTDGFNPVQDYQAFLALEWDIFDGFNNKYAIQSARQLARQARQSLRQQELSVLSNVWTNFFAFRSAIREVQANRSAVEAQREAYEAISIGYNTGINSLLDLLTAQQDLDTAQQNFVQSEADLSISVANLANAIGALPTSADASAQAINAMQPAPSDEEDFWQQYFGGP